MATKQQLADQIGRLLSITDNVMTPGDNEGLTKERVKELESKLREAGYKPGNDGSINNPTTINSILQFYKDHTGKYADKANFEVQNAFRLIEGPVLEKYWELNQRAAAGSMSFKDVLKIEREPYGQEVSRLQFHLVPHGYPRNDFDTDFGPQMATALANYIQKNPKSLGNPHDQKAEGSVEISTQWLKKLTDVPQVAQTLRAAANGSPEFIERTHNQMRLLSPDLADAQFLDPESKQAWTNVQTYLKVSGHYKGAVTGEPNQQTLDAWNGFLRDHPNSGIERAPGSKPNSGTIHSGLSENVETFVAAHDGLTGLSTGADEPVKGPKPDTTYKA